MTQETSVEAVREVITKYDCVQYKDFWAYVEKKRTTKLELLKLKPERREEFFMKWKHGMSDMNTNWEFEYTLRAFLRSFKDTPLDAIDPHFRTAVKIRREFDSYCDSIKHQLGLWTGKKDMPEEVKRLLDQVNGKLTSDLIKSE